VRRFKRTAILGYEPRKETPLTVAEAERILSDLAKGGHLQMRVEGGASYSTACKRARAYHPQLPNF
jgi:hypothetical protein